LLYLDSGISSADFMILSCILLRKMEIVVVSGFDAVVGLGRLGETCGEKVHVRRSAFVLNSESHVERYVPNAL